MSEKFEIYAIGDRTAELVFRAAGITNVSDLQAVLDQVEVALKQSAELHSLYDAIGFDPLDLENGHDNARAAIDALLKAEREKALREAAEVCERVRTQKANGPMPEGACFDYEQSILALIKKDATDV